MKRTADLRGNTEANELMDRILYLRKIKSRCDLELKIFIEKFEEIVNDSELVIADRHIVSLVDRHVKERIMPPCHQHFYTIKEMALSEDLRELMDKLENTLRPRKLKSVT